VPASAQPSPVMAVGYYTVVLDGEILVNPTIAATGNACLLIGLPQRTRFYPPVAVATAHGLTRDDPREDHLPCDQRRRGPATTGPASRTPKARLCIQVGAANSSPLSGQLFGVMAGRGSNPRSFCSSRVPHGRSAMSTEIISRRSQRRAEASRQNRRAEIVFHRSGQEVRNSSQYLQRARLSPGERDQGRGAKER